jgi:DNA-binding NarL/FixJ family response regulator
VGDEREALLAAARAAYRAHAWPAALEGFRAARAGGSLPAQDLSALADAAWWLGRVDESIAEGERAYRAHLEEGRPRAAAWTAIGVAVNFLLRGDEAVGSGWIGRAARLLADEPECVEQGYLAYLLEIEGALDSPDRDAVLAAARRVREMGRRYDDPNLVAASLLGEGRVLLRMGQVAQGMALLDEAMATVLSGDVAPDWAGNIYCHMMAACIELADLRRARQWVAATESWLDALPAAVLFTGICRVHRSQVLQAGGQWDRAEEEAARVCAELADIARTVTGEGYYQLGELRRLRGQLDAAEAAYQRAHRLGRDPQPRLALLRCLQGRSAAALASVRAALLATAGRTPAEPAGWVGQAANRLVRARLLTAAVDIALAAGAVAEADAAAAELATIAEEFASPGFTAAGEQARGAVLLARDRPAEALPVLRSACHRWQELDAPYDCARVRVLLAAAYQALGDADGAELELAAAAEVFETLGAGPDAAAVAAQRGLLTPPGGLTEREAEVLACLAAGSSNREIAAALVISEKTVARHLSNIFTKLGVTSRTAAAAYAHRHGIPARG